MNRGLDLSGAKILTVDDVPANLDVLSRALESDGFNVLVATSGEAALQVAARTLPDLILMDVMMPGMNGYEACRRLKATEATAEIPVIFLTALEQTEEVVEGFDAGGVDYVTKPFRKEEVLARIRTHLENAILHRQVEQKNAELADLNAHLEQKVAERTEALAQKVKELEGRDRIAHHLLTVHTLEDTLNLVLEVIADVMTIDRAVIYLGNNDNLRPVAARGVFERDQVAPAERLRELEPVGERKDVVSDVARTRTPRNVTEPSETAPFAVVPILRGEDLLGIVEVDRSDGAQLSEEALHTMASFALQAAVAIGDSQVQQDAALWKGQLDDVMNLDDVLENTDQLDDLAGEEGRE